MSKSVVRRFPAFCLVLVAASLTLFAGCASMAKSKGAWTQGATRGQGYSTLLLVGVSPNRSQRCAFERILARRLRNDHTLVATSCDALKNKETLTREDVEAAVDELGIDAVMATLLVKRKIESKEGGSRDTRGGAYYKATDSGWAYGWDGYYGMYGVPVIYADFTTAAPINTIEADVEVSTKVYDVKTKQPVYTVNTRLNKIKSRDEGFLAITAAIAEKLQDDGLVKGDD